MSVQRLTEIDELQLEKFTKFKIVIDSDHAYIHKGYAYTAIVDAGTISAAYDIAFTTPHADTGKFIHWRPSGIQTSANYVAYQLTEAETFTGGTAVTPINRNRLSVKTSGMQAFVKNATATPAGTIIQLGGVGTAGVPSTVGGGGAAASHEIILKQNTTYVMTLTPAGATAVTMELFWYEEDMGE